MFITAIWLDSSSHDCNGFNSGEVGKEKHTHSSEMQHWSCCVVWGWSIRFSPLAALTEQTVENMCTEQNQNQDMWELYIVSNTIF